MARTHLKADCRLQTRRTLNGYVLLAALCGLLGSTRNNTFGQDLAKDSGESRQVIAAELAVELFELPDDVQIELVAAEPDVVDPVAMAFDEQGRLWVVEMRDYPVQSAQALSRVVILQDVDGDGRFHQTSVFADGLAMANGILPWAGGAIVTLGGQVVWLPDDDHNGVADARQIWFEGFAQENPQLRASHPTWSPDARVFVANGLRGGEVTVRNPAWSHAPQPISLRGFGFSFDPRYGRATAVTGNGQFGLTIDDFGQRLFCSNRNPCMHVVIEDHYARRVTDLRLAATTTDVAAAGEFSRVFPISQFWTTSNLHEGQFTAACGLLAVHGNGLPSRFANHIFVCEPTGNLVHTEQLSAEGATFAAKPDSTRHEFLATRDEWFRPVNLASGPDGALYVVDMHRRVIEHPDWMPEELRQRDDMTWGADRGRIYRVIAKDRSDAQAAELVGDSPSRKSHDDAVQNRQSLREFGSSAELVATLRHSNGWHRDTASRLIYEAATRKAQASKAQTKELQLSPSSEATEDKTRPDNENGGDQYDGIPALQHLALDAEASDVARARAIGLLFGLQSLSPRVVQQVLASPAPSPSLKRFALSLGERALNDWIEIPTATDVKAGGHADVDNRAMDFKRQQQWSEILSPDVVHVLLQNVDLGLRFQLALSAGVLPAERRGFLVDLACRDRDDPWMQAAVKISAADIEFLLLQGLGFDRANEPLANELWRLVGRRYGGSPSLWREPAWQQLVDPTAPYPGRTYASLTAFAVGLRERGDAGETLAALSGGDGADGAEPTRSLATWNERALKLVASPNTEPTVTQQAIGWLRYSPNAWPALAQQLAAPPSDPELALAMIDALAACRDPQTTASLIASLPRQTPRVRSAIVEWLVSNDQRAQVLLTAMLDEQVNQSTTSLLQTNQLRKHRNAQIRELAQRVWPDQLDRDEQLKHSVIERYAANRRAGDILRGKVVFQQHCATCHRVNGIGVDVAPDISDSRVKTPAQLLEAILDPNRAIDNNYVAYQITTNSGVATTGILVSETTTELTVRVPGGTSMVVAKSDIAQLQSTGMSLMPSGFERLISVEEMTDLIEFLKNWRYQDGRIPGIQPLVPSLVPETNR